METRLKWIAWLAAALGVVGLAGIAWWWSTPRGATPTDPAPRASTPEVGTGRGAGARPTRGAGSAPAPTVGARMPDVDRAALAAADPRALGVQAQVVRALDQLAAPVAIRRVSCAGATCDVVLEAKSREDAGELIDRLSEPGHGFAGEAKSMTLHAVTTEPAAGGDGGDVRTVFGFTLTY